MTLRPAILVLALGACTEPPEPRPGTQIGVEEHGGLCKDDTVTPVVDIDAVPEGGSMSLSEALVGASGRFVGTTREGEPLTVEIDADVDSAVWVTQRASATSSTAACPPLWRLDVDVEVRTDEVDWAAMGTLSLQEDGTFVQADGPADVGMEPPADVEAESARLLGFGGGGSYSVSLMWRGRGGVDGDAVEWPVLTGDVDLD